MQASLLENSDADGVSDVNDGTVHRDIDDIMHEISGHLTKEERLCVSLYKNSRGQRNTIHRIFLKKYYGKYLTSGAITYRKKRMFSVLAVVGTLVRYKKEAGIDSLLKGILTKRQYTIITLYEKRKTYKEMTATLGIKEPAIWRCYDRALERLKQAKNAKINKYRTLVKKVTKFSRKFTQSKNN